MDINDLNDSNTERHAEAEDTKTRAWTPSGDTYHSIRKIYPAPAPPPVKHVKLERYAAYPLRKIAEAIRSDYLPSVNHMLANAAAGEMPKTAFMGDGNSRVLTIYEMSRLPDNLWYVGDLHGDLLALLAIVEYIDSYPADSPPTIIFLGDAFDRIEFGFEVLLALFNLIINRPGQILLLAGNHDTELYYRRNLGVFYPGVMPANFCDWLNRQLEAHPERIEFGRNFIEFSKKMPHVLFLPDGTFAAHGGVPHIDVQKRISTALDLNTIYARQDFVWGRFNPDEQHVMPDRSHKDLGIGYGDFDRFCELAADILSMPVKRMVHGHEHPYSQWTEYPRYRKHPILTLNSHRMQITECDVTDVAIARHRPDDIPEVHLLDLCIPSSVIN